MDLDRQQRVFSRLRDAAGGDLHLVERALILAQRDNDGGPPSATAVLQKITQLRRAPEQAAA